MKKIEKKVISITLLMVILLAMLIPSISLAATEEITINDGKLKEAIVNEVDVNKDGKITKEEMKELGHIDIPEGVTDLTGLEYATNLGSMNIIYTEATPNLIGEIKSEEFVRVNMTISASVKVNSIVKLDFLKKIKNLKELFIVVEDKTDWQKVDYSTLKDLKYLRVLSLGAQVMPNSISELGNISSLESLSLSGEDGIDGSISMNGIEKLANLWLLNITHCDINDIAKIGEVKKLEHLHIEDIYTKTDISFLENNETVKELLLINLPFVSMEDISVISTLPNLKELIVDVGGIRILGVEQFQDEYQEFLKNGEKDESLANENSNTENTEKAVTETKTETKKQAEKPTRIPQAGINVVGNAISILVAISVFLLAVAFVKAKRK